MLHDWRSLLARTGAYLLVLASWQLTAVRVYPELAPLSIVAEVWHYYPNPEFTQSVLASLRRIVVGFSIGTALGLVSGLGLGLHASTRGIVEPIWGVLRPISPLAWVPLSIVWFGITERAAVFLIAFATFFPMMLNTLQGVRDVNPVYEHAALTLGASRFQIIRKVILPASVPNLLTGLRIAMGLAWGVIVAAELVIGFVLQSGLGYLMFRYTMFAFRPARVLAVVLMVGTMAYVLDRLLRKALAVLAPWRGGTKAWA